ncbi:MAG: zinc finger domain-containing protein [Candidatus Njordarchaeia archaeon]
MHRAELFRSAPKSEQGMPESRDRKSCSEPRLIELPRCTACGKVIHPTDRGAIAIPCPNCGKGIIVRCSDCRTIGNIAKCPICGYEFP